MVGSDDQEIRLPQCRKYLREALVEALEIARVAFDIVAMAIKRIEVDEIDEDEPRAISADDIQQLIDALAVAFRRNGLDDAPAGEQISDLAD